MRIATVLLALACLCLFSSAAVAHDDDRAVDVNGNGYLDVYRVGNYGGDWGEYMRVANRQLSNHAPEQPLMRLVKNKEAAELYIHTSKDLTGCFGWAWTYPSGFKEIKVSPVCKSYEGVFSHEVGHVYGLPAREKHHRCTPYWQKRSVDVGDRTPNDGILQGCPVTIVGFGPHDLRALATPDP